MTIKDKLKAIKWYQKCGDMHPLTCRVDSNHKLLLPKIVKHNKIVLVCPTCGYIQPESKVCEFIYMAYILKINIK